MAKINRILTAALISAFAIGICTPAANAATVTETSAYATTQTFKDGDSSFSISYDPINDMFVTYKDGKLVSQISRGNLVDRIEKTQKYFKQSKMSCSVGFGIVGIINGALWTAAGITAPASAGASIGIAGFVTSLIPTFGGFLC